MGTELNAEAVEVYIQNWEFHPSNKPFETFWFFLDYMIHAEPEKHFPGLGSVRVPYQSLDFDQKMVYFVVDDGTHEMRFKKDLNSVEPVVECHFEDIVTHKMFFYEDTLTPPKIISWFSSFEKEYFQNNGDYFWNDMRNQDYVSVAGVGEFTIVKREEKLNTIPLLGSLDKKLLRIVVRATDSSGSTFYVQVMGNENEEEVMWFEADYVKPCIATKFELLEQEGENL